MTTRIPPHDPDTGGSRGRALFVTAVGVIVGAGVIAGIFLGLGGWRGTPPSPPAASAAHHVTPAPPAGPPAPAPADLATVQRQLDQLGYYDGPITGTMTPQTVDAIRSLQRDAQLPPTGVWDGATEAALRSALATGHHP
jgi:hypothetical protein